jgi:predicted nucleotidyltransferase
VDRVTRLEPRLAAELCAISQILSNADLEYAVIGANGLVLLGIELLRTTRDLDLTVVVTEGLPQIREVFADAGLRSTRIGHRFVAAGGMEVDVLPLQPGQRPDKDIRFPDGERISAVGLSDAVEHAKGVELGDCAIHVAPLPILTAIKLHTAIMRWGDRDLDDALSAMEQFEARGRRRFEVDYESAPGLLWETAGAFLLGRDATSMTGIATRTAAEKAVRTLLEDPRTTDRFTRGEERGALLRAFLAGMTGGSPTEGT